MATRATSFDGTEISWTEVGDGPPVMLVHGITESSQSWQPIADRLSASSRVISLDLRGHGESDTAGRYDLEAMALDMIAVAEAADVDRPHLVGHSLGGMVATAVGSFGSVASVVNVDQSLRLAPFKTGLDEMRTALKSPEGFPIAIEQLFTSMRGVLDDVEFERLAQHRRADQEVVLAVWDVVLNATAAELEQAVEQALVGYANSSMPHLSLFGIDPGDDYATWLSGRIPGSSVELWPGVGHYPHLVDPDRFVDRLSEFWSLGPG